jgi:hypothetical protein
MRLGGSVSSLWTGMAGAGRKRLVAHEFTVELIIINDETPFRYVIVGAALDSGVTVAQLGS